MIVLFVVAMLLNIVSRALWLVYKTERTKEFFTFSLILSLFVMSMVIILLYQEIKPLLDQATELQRQLGL